MDAVAAVGTVAFFRPGVHVAIFFAQVTIIAGAGFENAEKAEAPRRFQRAAGGAGKAAPGGGQNDADGQNRQYKERAGNPDGLGEIPGLGDGREKLADPDGDIHPRLVHFKQNPQGHGKAKVLPPGQNPLQEALPFEALRVGETQQTVDETAGAQPTAECAAEKCRQ